MSLKQGVFGPTVISVGEEQNNPRFNVLKVLQKRHWYTKHAYYSACPYLNKTHILTCTSKHLNSNKVPRAKILTQNVLKRQITVFHCEYTNQYISM